MQSLSLQPRRNSTSSTVVSCRHFDECHQTLSAFLQNSHGVLFCIVDANVWQHWQQALTELLSHKECRVEFHVFEASEYAKSLTSIDRIISAMQAVACDRSCQVVGIGGGVTTDVAGLVAALFMRGVPFVALPTSLLAMVDASVGGKNGVNTALQKNVIGTIVQPQLVVSCIEFLQTLPPVEVLNGFAEVLKMACITNDPQLKLCIEDVRRDPLQCSPEELENIVHRCCQLKAEIVEEDETDTGKRAILNFGHTYGHALEAVSDFEIKHGFAVAEGMRQALHWSVQHGGLSEITCREYCALLNDFGLSVGAYARMDNGLLVERMGTDKKRLRGRDRLVVLGADCRAKIIETDYATLDILDTPMQFCVSIAVHTNSSISALPEHHVCELCIQPGMALEDVKQLLARDRCVLTLRNIDGHCDQEQVHALRIYAWQCGHLVDIDARELERDKQSLTYVQKTQLVYSRHDVATEHEALSFLEHCAQEFPQAIVKIVLSTDIIEPISTCSRIRKAARKLGLYRSIVHVMSEDQSTRLIGAVDENYWTYLTRDKDSAVAVGQVTCDDAAQHYQLARLSHSPTLYGLIGDPVNTSPGYKLHNYLLQQFGLQALYVPIQVKRIDEFLERELSHFVGLSVTMPWKQAAAQFVGADEPINTLVRRDGNWFGHNTDVIALERLLPQQGKSALVYGTGATAHNVVTALRNLGYKHIEVCGRNETKVIALQSIAGRIDQNVDGYDVMVNASALGMYKGDKSPFSSAQLRSTRAVFDCVHNPSTALREQCDTLVLPWQGGQAMFVEQALEQFSLFTGIDTDKLNRTELIELCFS